MRHAAPALLAASLAAGPLRAQDAETLERALSGALRGCELWVLEPQSWSKGTAPFQEQVGLGERMGLVEAVPDVALPPAPLRAGNLYWRINATETAGYFLVVSFQMPMCHITGGGEADLQPVVEHVLANADFRARWDLAEDQSLDDMRSTVFVNKAEPRFTIQVSRAPAPGGRLDHVQLLATAMLDLTGDAEKEDSGPGE